MIVAQFILGTSTTAEMKDLIRGIPSDTHLLNASFVEVFPDE